LVKAHHLGGRRPGLGELAGDPAHLHHRHAGAVGEHHRHLEDDLELVADDVGGEVLEGLGAVAGLEQEGPARGHVGQRGRQLAHLTGEDQWRLGREALEDVVERALVGPFGLLRRGPCPPAAGCPGGRVGSHGRCAQG
jgi:hypothetical protein